MFGTISTDLPPSGEKQFRKLAKNFSGGYTYASFGSGEIPKVGGRKSHSRYLYIHRLSRPPAWWNPKLQKEGEISRINYNASLDPPRRLYNSILSAYPLRKIINNHYLIMIQT